MSPSGGNARKAFDLLIPSQESSKINKYFLTNEEIQSLLPAQTQVFQFPFA